MTGSWGQPTKAAPEAKVSRTTTYSDLQAAADGRDPAFVDLLLAYLDEGDPEPGQPEDPPEIAPGVPAEPLSVADDAWTLPKLKSVLSAGALAKKNATERKLARKEAWDALMASPHPPPRLRLGELLLKLYQADDAPARAIVMDLCLRAPLSFGLWQGMKAIYKLAEARHDAPVFGALAYRFEAERIRMARSPNLATEIDPGTLVYLRRRSWRYLRMLGRALPELYPDFAVEVLRHYPQRFDFRRSWVAAHIFNHKAMLNTARPGKVNGPPKDLSHRAFAETWKRSPDPLLRLLEESNSDSVADFTIRSLEADHPEALRKADPAWLLRLGRRPVPALHLFVVKVLKDTPTLHPSQFAALGLAPLMTEFLGSAAEPAAAFALEYLRAHPMELPAERLLALLEDASHRPVRQWVVQQLTERSPRALGLAALAGMFEHNELRAAAATKLKEGFTPNDLDEASYVRLFLVNDPARKALDALYRASEKKAPAAFILAVLASDEADWSATRTAQAALESYTGAEIGFDWIKGAVLNPKHTRMATQLLGSGKFSGDLLDVEWLKGLVMRPALRSLALGLLADPSRVAPSKLGVGWLLAMARQADPELSTFAQHHLLQHFGPADYAPAGTAAALSKSKGLERLRSLLSASEPEGLRVFAATALLAQHPELGPLLPEARSLGLKPTLLATDFEPGWVMPLFESTAPDVRRFAAQVAKHGLVRWGDPKLLYQLASSEYREPRGAASELLLAIGEPDADPARTPPDAWLDPAQIFALAESQEKRSRELALALIRRHYARLGGAEKLAWLMESADREVRLAAVRLLWEQHRPSAIPLAFQTKHGRAAPQRFESVDALRYFIRNTLFGLPPGRLERSEAVDGKLPDRALSASVAKRRLIEIVRDLALTDRGFAEIVAPVLETFAQSRAKGEWQASLAALARIQAAHPGLSVALGR